MTTDPQSIRLLRKAAFATYVAMLAVGAALAQQPAQQPVASVATTGGVSLHGALSVANGRAAIANNGEVTAGDTAASLALARGGTVTVCASTTVHIARDAAPHTGPGDAGLMFSLDRGAFEANYTPGAYSDVVLTADLRLLISSPGTASLKIRVNQQGDTCVDNAGDNAPYVVASSLRDGGAYRVRPGQRVLFVHGSLDEVVDNEHEPCGCPPAIPAAVAQTDQHPGGPSSTPADTAFPTAVSEGLQPPQTTGSTPVAAPGEVHAQVAATLSSNTPPVPPPDAAPPQPVSTAAARPSPAPPQAERPRGFLHSLGHFISKVFGAN